MDGKSHFLCFSAFPPLPVTVWWLVSLDLEFQLMKVLCQTNIADADELLFKLGQQTLSK